jgi:hypothetical protein
MQKEVENNSAFLSDETNQTNRAEQDIVNRPGMMTSASVTNQVTAIEVSSDTLTTSFKQDASRAPDDSKIVPRGGVQVCAGAQAREDDGIPTRDAGRIIETTEIMNRTTIAHVPVLRTATEILHFRAAISRAPVVLVAQEFPQLGDGSIRPGSSATTGSRTRDSRRLISPTLNTLAEQPATITGYRGEKAR